MIIEYQWGSDQAIRFLEAVDAPLCVSAITVAELYSGVKGDDGQAALQQSLRAFELIAVDEELTRR